MIDLAWQPPNHCWTGFGRRLQRIHQKPNDLRPQPDDSRRRRVHGQPHQPPVRPLHHERRHPVDVLWQQPANRISNLRTFAHPNAFRENSQLRALPGLSKQDRHATIGGGIHCASAGSVTRRAIGRSYLVLGSNGPGVAGELAVLFLELAGEWFVRVSRCEGDVQLPRSRDQAAEEAGLGDCLLALVDSLIR